MEKFSTSQKICFFQKLRVKAVVKFISGPYNCLEYLRTLDGSRTTFAFFFDF